SSTSRWVCAPSECLCPRQPTVSHHLKIMAEVGLLEHERRGTWAWVSVDQQCLRGPATA
ncbi:helix-turn-helix transcriptional regulator, partial [Streptomyces sp. SID8455]|nr:helix-turn-helix transcriptional regulator [Streptomyces sp. SID8455]